MPKLNAAIENIELNTNKIRGSVPLASWTDTQYPTAKTLYNTYTKLLDLMHPVGSILTTSTNTNPASTLGGTWTLVGKDAKELWMQIPTTAWTPGAADINIDEAALSYVLFSGNLAHFRMYLTTDTALSDSNVILGTFDPEQLGLTRIPYSILGEVAISDGGQCTLGWKLATDGVMSTVEALNLSGSHTMESGQAFYLNFTYVLRSADVLDEYCDKFHWERTA